MSSVHTPYYLLKLLVMRLKKHLAIGLLLILLVSCGKDKPTPAPEGCNATYTGDIKTIVASKCAIAGCHNGQTNLVNFTTYANLKARADNGRLKEFVLDKGIMPPANATQLTESEKETFKCWLEDDAPE